MKKTISIHKASSDCVMMDSSEMKVHEGIHENLLHRPELGAIKISEWTKTQGDVQAIAALKGKGSQCLGRLGLKKQNNCLMQMMTLIIFRNIGTGY